MSVIPQNKSKRKKKPKKAINIRTFACKEYFSYKDFDYRVTTIPFLERFAENMIKYALTNEDCLTVEDLFVTEGIPGATYYDWVNDHKFFRDAHKYAKEIIGMRREKGGLKRKFDASFIKESMYQYNKRWKIGEEYKQSLKDKNDSSSGNITVVIDKAPNSDMVPPKQTPEEVAAKIHKSTQSVKKY